MEKISLSHKEKVSIGAFSEGRYYGDNLSIEVFFIGKYSKKNHFVVNIADSKKILKNFCKEVSQKGISICEKQEFVSSEGIAAKIFTNLNKLYQENPMTKCLFYKVNIFFESQSKNIEILTDNNL